MTSYAPVPLPDDPYWAEKDRKVNAWLKANGIDHKREDMIRLSVGGPMIEYTMMVDDHPQEFSVPRVVRPNLWDWHKGFEEAVARGSVSAPVVTNNFSSANWDG